MINVVAVSNKFSNLNNKVTQFYRKKPTACYVLLRLFLLNLYIFYQKTP